MTSPANHRSAAAAWRPPAFVLRDGADLRRLFLYLLTHWTLPDVDFRVERLPVRDSHRAQHRFVSLAAACNCLVGELLGGAVLLVGSCMAWASAHEWRNLALALLIALGAGLTGKALELAWTRARLLREVRRLQQGLAETSGHVPDAPVKAAAAASYAYPLNRDTGPLHADRVPRAQSAAITHRPVILLRDAGDIRRLALHLITRWTLPHMRIEADALPGPIVRRAQDRLVRLSAGYNYLLAAVLALVCLLGGLAAVVWPTDEMKDELVLWTVHPTADWSGVLLVLLATLCTALLGWLVEVLWVRLRLLWVLLGLSRRMRGAAAT